MSTRSRTVVMTVFCSLALSAFGASAQASAPASAASGAAQRPMSVSARASGAAAAAPYRSAFENYRGWEEQPVVSWRQANDLVGRIGGWQTYAREGQGGEPGPATGPDTAQPRSASAAGAAPSSSASGAHSGHRKP